MARYLCLLTFTERGNRALKKSVARARAFAKTASSAGVTVEFQAWTTGRYDGFLVLHADTPEPVLRCLAKLRSQGCVSTETLTALNGQEFQALTRP